MELENFRFYLFDRVLKNGLVSTLIISIHEDTGETIILSKSADGSSDYRPMKKEQIDLNEENSNSYLTVIRMLNEYLKDYNPELMINDFKKAEFEDGTPFLTKNKNLKDAALFKHGAEQYCKIYLNFLQDQKFKIVSPAKENLFSFTPGLSEKNIFKMSIQQNNSNAKNKK